MDQTVLDYRDDAGLEEIPRLANDLALSLREALGKADDLHSQLERAYSDALRFDPSEGRWRAVVEKTRTAANGMWDYWKKARESAHKACDETVRGGESKIVQNALSNLRTQRSSQQTDLDRVKADYNRWYDGIKELRQWYSTDSENVRQAFCALQESPGDYFEGDAYINTLETIVERMVSHLTPKWNEIQRTAGDLISRLAPLEQSKPRDVSDAAKKLHQDIDRTVRGIEQLLTTELKGRANAEIRAFIEVGKNEHKRIQSDSSKCTKSELTFGSRRLDCIRVDGAQCYVVEIKPDNPAARERAQSQLSNGIEEVQRAMNGKKLRSEMTGNLELLRPCFDESNQRLALQPELRVYSFCPPQGKLFHDFVVP